MDNLVCLMFFLFFSTVYCCDRCVHQGKAAYFQDSSALSHGACGYGSTALDLNLAFLGSGYLASGVSSIYKDGVSCGACFQIRCTNRSICTTRGTKVVLFDLNKDNRVDFVLSSEAFKQFAYKNMREEMSNLGIVDVEYKRIPCDYNKQNLLIRVEEMSQKPNYLAIKFLYQGGQTDILNVDMAEVGSSNWRNLSRNYGAVWDTRNSGNVPRASLKFRMLVRGGYDATMVYATKVLPADWNIGGVYDLGVQFHEIAQERCSPCDDKEWK